MASAAVALGDSGVTVSSTTLHHLKECVEAAASKSSSQTPEDTNAVFQKALEASGLSKDEMVKALLVQKALGASGVSPQVMAQAVLLQKALAASGAGPDEIVKILAEVCDPKYTDDQVAALMKRALERRGSVTPQDLDTIVKLQLCLR